MAKPTSLVLEAYGELSLEPRQYVKWRPRRTSWMAWLIFCNLVFNFFIMSPCEHACHTASLHTGSYAGTNDTSGRRQSNHSGHIWRHLLWAYSKNVYSYFSSSRSQRYVHADIADICTFCHKSCASEIEVLKMFPLCFEPQPLLQKGSKASVCIHAKARGSFLL